MKIISILLTLDMTETLFSELLKNGILVTVLAFIAYVLWKRDDRRTRANEVEIKELRDRYEKEIMQDRSELKMLVHDNTTAVKEVKEAVTGFKHMMETVSKTNERLITRANTVMECLTAEIKNVKPLLQKNP